MERLVCLPLLFVLIWLPTSWLSAAENLSVRSSHLEVRLQKGLSGIAAIEDLKTGRDYAQQPAKPLGLYSIEFAGEDRKSAVRSVDAVRRSCRAIPDGLELQFEHDSKLPIKVICRILGTPKDATVRWQIEVHNRSGKASDTPAGAIQALARWATCEAVWPERSSSASSRAFAWVVASWISTKPIRRPSSGCWATRIMSCNVRRSASWAGYRVVGVAMPRKGLKGGCLTNWPRDEYLAL